MWDYMQNKYKHGGGYKRAALRAGLNWNEVVDYSTSVNWKATEFYPEELIYLHYKNIEYPNPDYPELKNLISDVYGFDKKNFILTHGANEAIASLFQLFTYLGHNNSKQIVLIGPTYCEYNKYSELYKFNFYHIDYEQLEQIENPENKIFIIVNPNTPSGIYLDIKSNIEKLLTKGSIVVVDESFLDFTDKLSLYELVNQYSNLFIIHSMTKFYGSAGARLGLILNSDAQSKELISLILPPWTISAYDEWFYINMIKKHAVIKANTLIWIKKLRDKIQNITNNCKNIRLYSHSLTHYHTLEINPEYLKNNHIEDFQNDFLNKYMLYIRPTKDFYGCFETSFRVGLRLETENEPFWQLLKDIG